MQSLLKENFLCAFTAPELLATLDTQYRIERQSGDDNDSNAKRLLSIWDRKLGRASSPLLGPVDLSHQSGRDEIATFFTEFCGRTVKCVVANDNLRKKGASIDRIVNRHMHQFGNTSSGVKNNKGDTRTIHIINESTVKQFSDKVFGNDSSKCLTSARFRPNIIVKNLEPWAEFDLIGQTIEVVPKKNDAAEQQGTSPLRFRIVSRTVRCAGVGVDPFPELGVVDIPKLLTKHFPEHGPYLGVYAIVDNEDACDSCVRTISVGDGFRVVER